MGCWEYRNVFLRPKVLSETAQESGDKRRRLCQGDANVTLLRAAQEAKRDEIAAEKSRELQAFYCEWCCKQYASVSEWEVRLGGHVGHGSFPFDVHTAVLRRSTFKVMPMYTRKI